MRNRMLWDRYVETVQRNGTHTGGLDGTIHIDAKNTFDWLWRSKRPMKEAWGRIASASCPPWNKLWLEAHDDAGGHYGAHVHVARARGEDLRGVPYTSKTRIGSAPTRAAVTVCAAINGRFLLFQCYIGWDDNGDALLCENGAPLMAVSSKTDEHRSIAEPVLGLGVDLCLATFAFCHCKNVTVEQEPLPDIKVMKKRERAGKPTIRWHTIRIDGLASRRAPTRADQDEDKIQKALHICRGHFATYSEDKPLFGKYAGRFWVPQHTRGSAEQGIVHKDYKVGPNA